MTMVAMATEKGRQTKFGRLSTASQSISKPDDLLSSTLSSTSPGAPDPRAAHKDIAVHIR